jgi:hypothetical protein
MKQVPYVLIPLEVAVTGCVTLWGRRPHKLAALSEIKAAILPGVDKKIPGQTSLCSLTSLTGNFWVYLRDS